MIKEPDVENGKDFRQYYSGAWVLYENLPCYIGAVQAGGDGEDSNTLCDMRKLTGGRLRSVAVDYGHVKKNMLFGMPELGMREVDGQLAWYGVRSERNGRRGLRPETITTKVFTESSTKDGFYPAEVKASQYKALEQLFCPTFNSYIQAVERLMNGATLGCALSHNMGLYVKTTSPCIFLAFRGFTAGYYDYRGLHLFPGFEGLRDYVVKAGGA